VVSMTWWPHSRNEKMITQLSTYVYYLKGYDLPKGAMLPSS